MLPAFCQTLATTEPKEYFKIKALDHVTYMDKNGDGEVDWKEFQDFMLPHVKVTQAKQQKQMRSLRLATYLPLIDVCGFGVFV